MNFVMKIVVKGTCTLFEKNLLHVLYHIKIDDASEISLIKVK